MSKINEIHESLKKIQTRLNPEKISYKTTDEILNNNLTAEEILAKVKSLRGIGRLPENLKQEYSKAIGNINLLLVKERKIKEKERLEENTKQLKEIVAALEKKTNKVNKEDKAKEEIKLKEEMGLVAKKEESKTEESIKVEPTILENIKEEPNIEKDFKSSQKRLYNILVFLILFSIIAIILILLFY